MYKTDLSPVARGPYGLALPFVTAQRGALYGYLSSFWPALLRDGDAARVAGACPLTWQEGLPFQGL